MIVTTYPFTYTNAISIDEEDMIEVSSLPSVGGASATKLYKLSTDDKVYYRNNAGTLWLPVGAPGWPRRDGADDEEWESADANPPTGWTWDNQDSTSDNENGTRKSFLCLTKTVNGAGHCVLYKNVPASPSNKTYYACLQWGSDLAGTSSNQQIGISLRNNTNGKVVLFVVASSANPTTYVSHYTTTTAFDSLVFSASVVSTPIPHQYFVLGVTYDGTNLSFKYSPYHGGSEETMTTVYTETVASFLGSFDAYGLTIYKNNGTSNQLYCDWIRVV